MPHEQESLPFVSTKRLELCPVKAADIGELIELDADPAVMTYIRGRAATPAETWQSNNSWRAPPLSPAPASSPRAEP